MIVRLRCVQSRLTVADDPRRRALAMRLAMALILAGFLLQVSLEPSWHALTSAVASFVGRTLWLVPNLLLIADLVQSMVWLGVAIYALVSVEWCVRVGDTLAHRPGSSGATRSPFLRPAAASSATSRVRLTSFALALTLLDFGFRDVLELPSAGSTRIPALSYAVYQVRDRESRAL